MRQLNDPRLTNDSPYQRSSRSSQLTSAGVGLALDPSGCAHVGEESPLFITRMQRWF